MRQQPHKSLVLALLVTVAVGCVGERTIVVGYKNADTKASLTRVAPDRPHATAGGSLRPGRLDGQGMPLLTPKPSEVTFDFAPSPKTSTSPIYLANTGTGVLEIEKFTLTGSAAFKVRAAGSKNFVLSVAQQTLTFEPALLVQPGDSLAVIVEHRPKSNAEEMAVLQVQSNDPSREQSVAIALRANVEPACLKLAPHQLLNFETVHVGTCRTKLVDARNCGKTPLVIENAGLINPAPQTPFSVSWGTGEAGQPWIDQQVTTGKSAAIVVQPGSKVEVAVTYCPAKALTAGLLDSAVVGVVSSASGSHTVVCSGEPVVAACPKAVAGVAQVESATVGTSLQLTSYGSKAPKGKVTNWQWSLTAPPASTAKLTPNSKVAAPSLVVDVAGSYMFCVDVWDDTGVKSCHTSCLTVHATENEVYQAGNYGAAPVW